MNLFDPWFFEEADTRERERRRKIGRLGRRWEDSLEVAKVALAIAISGAVTFIPWAVGIATIVHFIITRTSQ